MLEKTTFILAHNCHEISAFQFLCILLYIDLMEWEVFDNFIIVYALVHNFLLPMFSTG